MTEDSEEGFYFVFENRGAKMEHEKRDYGLLGTVIKLDLRELRELFERVANAVIVKNDRSNSGVAAYLKVVKHVLGLFDSYLNDCRLNRYKLECLADYIRDIASLYDEKIFSTEHDEMQKTNREEIREKFHEDKAYILRRIHEISYRLQFNDSYTDDFSVDAYVKDRYRL